MAQLSVEQVAALAIEAHGAQVDLIGVPYREHLRAVADGVAPFGPQLEMAGWLHDVLEDTAWTAEELRRAGVPNRVIEIVELVTRTPERGDYQEMIREIVRDPDATLVKIADNAHNSRADRAAALQDADKRGRLHERYRQARETLWAAASPERVTAVVSRVNPSLLDDLPDTQRSTPPEA